ncbi:MAG: acyl-CoA desaturase [Gammaproteobacteria bacterium]|nr:acyl-CoA desaturase [Gammaproteobacteria bacterium]
MFAITAGYHRYFAHRAFKTGRAFQFVLGFLAQSSVQSGLIWWAAKHREHHRYSDTPRDVHSPRQYGFWFSHLGWIFNQEAVAVDDATVSDLTRYPELRWLEKHYYAPPLALAALVLALSGWSGLVVGFFWSTALLYHFTFSINSLTHMFGRARYLTGDESRNNWWLALPTMGEGWHNNHHYCMASARQGFYWWEVDLTYYILRALAVLGVVWDLRLPPAHVVRGQREITAETKERSAALLASSFPADRIVTRLQAQYHAEARDEWRRTLAEALARGRGSLVQLHLPELPSLDDMRARACRMFARSPAMDEIVARARELLAQAVSQQLLHAPSAT